MKQKQNNVRKFIFNNEIIKIEQDYNNDIDLSSIAEWIACGFFLGDRNFTKQKFGEKENYSFESNWYYNPKDISFKHAVEEFSHIFENIINKNIHDKNIILPLSGGLDSRTIAVALRKEKNVTTYSYEFENGIAETKYARKISDAMGWIFHDFLIPKGYLWGKLDKLAEINYCQSDFVHPRQIAVMSQVCNLGDCIISGQWGDVLFDLPKISNSASINEQTRYTFNTIVKPGGLALSNKLWEEWGFLGEFNKILFNRIRELLIKIKIDNPSRRILAFKSLHWAQRWANPNLKIFSEQCNLITPYYDDEICNFICKIPNKFLVDRKIQIEYIKKKSPMLANIPWQVYDLNLYKFKYFNSLYFFKRVFRYIYRKTQDVFFNSANIVERNWEIQFLGKKNIIHLENWLFQKTLIRDIVSEKLIRIFYDNFKNENQIFYSHPISMLLTLSVWCEKFWKKK